MNEILGKITETTKNVVKNTLPSDYYSSTVGVYGGEIINTPDKKMVYKTSGLRNYIDVKGDSLLRSFDDHVVKNPFKTFIRNPVGFFEIMIHSEPMRRRGSPQEIADNIKRLGLEEFYGLHPNGIEIKKPEIFTKGIAIGDIFRADLINSLILNDIDRFQALEEATKYISNIHQNYGPAGDIVEDIMFQKKEGSKVINPVLNLPDVILTPSKKRINLIKNSLVEKEKKVKIEEKKETKFTSGELESIDIKTKEIIAQEQKAVDIAELMISTAFEEFRRSKNPQLVEKVISTILDNYQDQKVLKIVRSFIKRGRHLMPDSNSGGMFKSFFSLHNTVHLAATKDHAQDVRKIIESQFKNYFLKSTV